MPGQASDLPAVRDAAAGRARRRLASPILVIVGLLAALAPAASPAAARPPGAEASDVVPGQLIVSFKKGVSSSKRSGILEQVGAKLRRRLAHVRGAVVAPRRIGLALLRRRLQASPGVAYVESDYILGASAAPDDPLFVNQYPLASTGVGGVGAQVAWNKRTNCSKLAVLDTGIQYSHPDLEPNVWHNSHEIKNNGKDDDKNGWVDDYYGVNIVKGKGSGKDDNGHGTHVSGIVAGRGNNDVGISGLCWTAKVMAVKFMNSRGKGSTSDAITGIDYAIHEGAKVINCSFGTSSKSQSLLNEVDYAKKKGVLLVVAAGNDGDDIDSKPSYPASFNDSNILTVAATTAVNGLASFSNFGQEDVDLGAPGDNILSTYPTSTYKTLSGTSMAAPLVSATAAMLRAQDGDLSYGDVRKAIRNNVSATPALTGKTYTNGQLNVAAALAAVP
jgi:subtilisin family serine protease